MPENNQQPGLSPELRAQRRDAYNTATGSDIAGAVLDFTDDMLVKFFRSQGIPEREIEKRVRATIDSLKKEPYTWDNFVKMIKRSLGGEEQMNNSVEESHHDEPASEYEAEMVINQIAFIKYAADEIEEHVRAGGVFPEWFQNKLSGVHSEIKGLHAYMEGERQQETRKKMVAMKDVSNDYFESLESRLSEAKKKIDKDEDPCWKGYKMVGTKKKNGKEVPNCVPGKKGD